MRPLSECPPENLAAIEGVFADIDDTLTTDGILTAAAYGAMERLQDADIQVFPITGRPAGWCDHIARMWPVDAVVGENGAFYFRYDDTDGQMIRHYADSPKTRTAHREKLALIREAVLTEVPGSAVAADQAYRETDLAIDFCEDVPPLDDDDVERIVAIFERHGATAKISSIHVNGWFGAYDKLTMTRRMMADEFGQNDEDLRHHFLFVGDSPNDAPMFGFFPDAVGVANVKNYSDHIDPLPAWVTSAESGAGFVELADAILAASPD